MKHDSSLHMGKCMIVSVEKTNVFDQILGNEFYRFIALFTNSKVV